MKELIRIGIRANAIFIPTNLIRQEKTINKSTALLVGNLAKLGFGLSEDLLYKINSLPPSYKLDIYTELSKILGTNKNWTPLVKGWETPTEETKLDHLITFIVNKYNLKVGVQLPCGHRIPENTFPMDRYNGCPFCGAPFEFGKIEIVGQGSKFKILELWSEEDVNIYFVDLLASKIVLDATQIDTLKTLISILPLPKVEIGVKETLIFVVDHLIEKGIGNHASLYLRTPVDIMRYLWYKQTGYLQIIEPSTLIKNARKKHTTIQHTRNRRGKAAAEQKLSLKLKYSRTECKRVAYWFNSIDMSPDKICEAMHPKRNMWVRFIRALRLAEYSKRKGFEKLKEVLDLFYNQMYEVWTGRVNYYRLRSDANKTFELLKQCPSLFARSLFSNMLWFGPSDTIWAFSQVSKQVPARLLFTLITHAQLYFDKEQSRSIKTLGGIRKNIDSNKYLNLYTNRELTEMKGMIADLCLGVMMERFAEEKNENKTIYIDPKLFNIPFMIGDRSDTVQDLPTALPGTRFEIEGHVIRLFMQWGKGMPAQHLDMDLSCAIVYKNLVDYCNYSQLYTKGAKHSGDIRFIPDNIGTAEYIEIDLEVLRKEKAKYVVFTSNAYSAGGICPELIVGWMDSKYKMKVSEQTGVAYDPSCVQHQIRVMENSQKGLVFGVLDVNSREIVWMEMSFGGQVVRNLSIEGVEALMAKLNSKFNLGEILRIKAIAQGLEEIETPNADENYTQRWARNTAGVMRLLLPDSN